MANLPKPDRLTSLPDVSSFAICSSVASIASLAWPLLSPVSSATARASSVLLMVPTAIPPGTGVRRRPYGGGRTEKARNGCGGPRNEDRWETAVMPGRGSGVLTAWFAVALAIGAGGSLATGHVVAGSVEAIAAVACVWWWIRKRDDDGG